MNNTLLKTFSTRQKSRQSVEKKKQKSLALGAGDFPLLLFLLLLFSGGAVVVVQGCCCSCSHYSCGAATAALASASPVLEPLQRVRLPEVAVQAVPVLEHLAAEAAGHGRLDAVEGLEMAAEDAADHKVAADGALDAAALGGRVLLLLLLRVLLLLQLQLLAEDAVGQECRVRWRGRHCRRRGGGIWRLLDFVLGRIIFEGGGGLLCESQ